MVPAACPVISIIFIFAIIGSQARRSWTRAVSSSAMASVFAAPLAESIFLTSSSSLAIDIIEPGGAGAAGGTACAAGAPGWCAE